MKPGIKKLAIQRSKQLNSEKKGELNMLLLRRPTLSGSFKLVTSVSSLSFDVRRSKYNLGMRKDSAPIKVR